MKKSHLIIAAFTAAALLLVVVVTFRAFSQIKEAAEARKQTFIVLNSADDLLVALITAETGQRGYLLTDDETFLEPYLAVCDSIGGGLERLRRLSSTGAAHKHLDALIPLIDAKLATLSRAIELRRNESMAAAIAVVHSGGGKRLMDSIRVEIQTFRRIEQGALARHDAEFQANMRYLFIAIIVSSLLILLLSLLFAYLIYQDTKNRLRNYSLSEAQRLLEVQETMNRQLQQANTALQISEEKFAVTLSSIGDAVMATDNKGCVTLLNPVAEKLTGWVFAEAAGRPVQDVFHVINQETRKPAAIPIQDTLAHGAIHGLANHTVLIARSGSECAIADSCAPIRNRMGEVVGAVLVFRDVTEEYALREYSENIINTVRESLITLDQNLRVVSVSRSFYDVFKVKPEETVGQLIFDLGNKQWDIPKLRELLETILPQKTAFDNYEVEHDFTTIGRRTMLLNARQIKRTWGQERIILLAIEDITERKHIAKELQKTQKELERIVQAQKLVISYTQENLNHETTERLHAESELSHRQEALEAVYAMETTFNSSIQSLYDQITVSIATTLRATLVTIAEYRDGKIIACSQCRDGRVSQGVTSAAPCAACRVVLDGRHPRQFCGDLGLQFDNNLCFDPGRFNTYAGVPINGTQGELFGLIVVMDAKNRTFTDDEIKFIEVFARYVAHELSRRDLESRLRRGEEMRLLGQLTSGVAHEVRNPLNGILAIMGALSKEFADNNRFDPYMKHMHNQVTRLTGLMEDLLALGRPLREENSHAVSVVTLVEDALSTWLQTLQSAEPLVRFVKPEAPETFVIKADSAYMTQMIINLFENAYNHSQAGAEIVCSVFERTVDTIALSVKDAGSGIPEENLPRIFDPFFTTRKGGTGLGLSIVRKIVENHNGRICAYNNTDGPGATFEVVLPLFTGVVAEAV
jgi:PAS domain S-box-containing protein